MARGKKSESQTGIAGGRKPMREQGPAVFFSSLSMFSAIQRERERERESREMKDFEI